MRNESFERVAGRRPQCAFESHLGWHTSVRIAIANDDVGLPRDCQGGSADLWDIEALQLYHSRRRGPAEWLALVVLCGAIFFEFVVSARPHHRGTLLADVLRDTLIVAPR